MNKGKGKMLRILILALLGIACWGTTLLAQGERIGFVDRRLSIELQNELPISIVAETIDGDMEVLCGEENVVTFVVRDFDADENEGSAYVIYDVESAKMRVVLRGEYRESDLAIYAPATALLKVKTVDGDLSISGCHGGLEAKTIDGDIELSDIQGAVAADTTDGDLKLVMGVGDLKFPISLATSDGDIEISLPANINVDLEASTMDGSFSSELPIDLKGKKGQRIFIRKNDDYIRIDGTINKGGAKISLKALDGDITINEVR